MRDPEARPPAYRIETERLVLRCWQPEDATLIKEAVDASLERLRPWMPWVAQEPMSLREKAELLRSFRGAFDVGANHVLGILDREETRALGGTGWHPRCEGKAQEIGYWIREDSEGRGLVSEAVAALTRVLFEVEKLDRVEICCDPANERSARVPRRLGYVEEARLRRRRPDAKGVLRDSLVFSMLAEDFPASRCKGAELAAFDVAGLRLL